jgi:hypothetical protein
MESFLDCQADQSAAIGQLRKVEAGAIYQRRRVAGVSDEQTGQPSQDESHPPDDLVGLALSGGGVRSAAFNLGFLQALSNADVLRYVDYLCSVSGGGYIAGHLTALASLRSATQAEATEPAEATPADTSTTCFHDSDAANLGLANRQRLEPHQYRFRHMGDYLTDYVGFLWRYVLMTIPLFFWALCLLGILATLAALAWRTCDLLAVRAYLDLIGLNRLGLALHIGNETPHAFLPSMLCFLALVLLVVVRWALPEPARRKLQGCVHAALVAWLISLGVSIAVFLGNGESSIGASPQLRAIQSQFTWPLLVLTLLCFLPLLAGRRLMQSGREHAPRWKKMLFHVFIGGATVSAAFLMVHLMARENISGFATNRDPDLLPEDIWDWNAFLALLESGASGKPVGPLGEVLRTEVNLGALRQQDFELRNLREAIIGAGPWQQWEDIPVLNLVEGTSRVISMHVDNEDNVFAYLKAWHALREQRKKLLVDVNRTLIDPPLAGAESRLTNRLMELALVRAKEGDETPARVASPLTLGERRQLEEFIDQRTAKMHDADAFRKTMHRYMLHLTHAESSPTAAMATFELTPAERAMFNRTLLELVYPDVIRERTMVSTLIVPGMDQWYRGWWLAFWIAGFLLVGLFVDINKLSPVYMYYRDRLNDYFVQSAPDALRAAEAPLPSPPQAPHWDQLRSLRPWERGAPYPLMLGSAFFLNKVGTVPSPEAGSAAADAFKLHSFLFSPFYCGTAAAGYRRTEHYCCGDLRLCEAMAISGAALTPFMVDNLWFSGLMAAFNFRIGQWLPNPRNAGGKRCRAIPLALVWEWWQSLWRRTYPQKWEMALVADGGFHDFFGIEELLVRRCSLIDISDAGCNNDRYEFGALADVIRLARERHGIDILDLDDDQAPDLCGVRRIPGENRQSLHHTCMRIMYPPGAEGAEPCQGLLVYAQMSLTGREQIDLQQFRNVHPNFPDEPITNQFFSHGQIESYRQLGFHVGNAVCRDVDTQPAGELRPSRRQIADDLVRGYLQEYYCHVHGSEADLQTHTRARLAAAERAVAGAETNGEEAELPQFAAELLETLRRPWFVKSPPQTTDTVLLYERDASCRHRALNDVAVLLDGEQAETNRAPVTPAELTEYFLACHERNAGTVRSRFAPGGRQILRRGLAELARLLPQPALVEHLGDIQLATPGPLLIALAGGVLLDAGPEALADCIICTMHRYGLVLRDKWSVRGKPKAYRDDLVRALRERDEVRVTALYRDWTLPAPTAVPEPVGRW